MFRVSGAANIAAGILMTAGFALHPAGEDATFGADRMWIPAHALLWLAFVIALLGWVGVYIAQAAKAGMLGVVAFVVIIIGTSLASWIFSSDVTFVPVIAAESPELFKKIFNTGHLVVGIASVLSWVSGSVLFGISIARAKVFPRWAGILLAVGTATVPVTYLAGLSVRVTALGAGLGGVSQIWLGASLLSRLRSPATSGGRA
jgi:hypothetical protein